MSGTQVDDRGLVHLRNLRNLKSLNIDQSRVTGEGYAHVQHLLDPEKVKIVPTRLGSRYLDFLKQCGPGPEWLARQIEEHRAEDYTIHKIVPAQGHVTLRPGWVLRWLPEEEVNRFDWDYDWSGA